MAGTDDVASTRPLASGETVRAYYHMNDHPSGYRYVRLLDGNPEKVPEGDAALIGLSTGWIPASVAEEWNPDSNKGGEDRVLVRLHGRFADSYRQDKDEVNGMYWRVKRNLVRPMGAPQAPAELSLLVVRWWDYYNPKNRRSRTHNVANEEMLLDNLEGPGSPHELFGDQGKYEVHSVFCRNTEDLKTITQSAQLKSMRGKQKAGLYFLWPTQRPQVERRLPGAVLETELFALMKRAEAEGINSCWPHPSDLYRQLAGKLWPAEVCKGRPDLQVPPTVQLDMARWEADPCAAAEEVIAELQQRNPQSASVSGYRGVVKLGFSWMGEDVRPFSGAAELVKVLRQFLEGAPQEAVCLVQERIEDVGCELRFICSRDQATGSEAVLKKLVRMRNQPSRQGTDDSFSMASHNSMSASECADAVFGGNAAALAAAEQEAERLADLWLAWFREKGYGVPASCRLDFLCTTKGKLWTVELCECGGSLCGLSSTTRATALLNDCLKDSSAHTALALPPLKVLYEGQPAGAGWQANNGSAAPGNSWPANKGNTALARSSKADSPSGLVTAMRSVFGKGRLAILIVLFLAFLRLRKKL